MSSKKPPLGRANGFSGCRTPRKQVFFDPFSAGFWAVLHSNQRAKGPPLDPQSGSRGSITNRSVLLKKCDFHPLSAALSPPAGGIKGGASRPFWPKPASSGTPALVSRLIPLRYATLRYATLRYRYATLRYATLRYATLRYRYATLRYATLPLPLRFASLRYASLPLRFASLRFASLHYATLRYTTLRYATLRYATLSHREPARDDQRGREVPPAPPAQWAGERPVIPNDERWRNVKPARTTSGGAAQRAATIGGGSGRGKAPPGEREEEEALLAAPWGETGELTMTNENR